MRRLPIAVVLLASLTACYRWQPAPLSPGEVPASTPTGPLRVTTYEGRVLIVQRPSFDADTLRGFLPSGGGSVVLALSGVRLLEIRRPDDGRTALAFLGVTVAATVVGLTIAAYVIMSDPNY